MISRLTSPRNQSIPRLSFLISTISCIALPAPAFKEAFFLSNSLKKYSLTLTSEQRRNGANDYPYYTISSTAKGGKI